MDRPNSLGPTVGIACATGFEANRIVKPLGLKLEEVETAPFGIFANEEVALIITGMRGGLARVGISRLLKKFGVIQNVINVGIAGSLNQDEYPSGTVIVGSSVQEHDTDAKRILELTRSADKLQKITNAKTARVLSGDQFIWGKTAKQRMDELVNLGDVVDMEAFAIAKKCMEVRVTPHVIKSISDIIQPNHPWRQLAGLPFGAIKAMKNTTPVLEEVLKILGPKRA